MRDETHHALPDRRSIRMRGFDYRENRAYFVTICTRDRACVFGSIVDGEMKLSRRGMVAAECWQAISAHFPHVELDAWVIMPNHVHGVLCFVGATHASPAPGDGPRGPAAGSLGALIGSYKSAVAREINKLRPGAAANLWQRNYYDHIVRDDRAFDRIRQYVLDNPSCWDRDEHNPDAVGALTFGDWFANIAGDACVAPTNTNLAQP